MDRAAALLLANHLRDIRRDLEETIIGGQEWKTSEVLKPNAEGHLESVTLIDKLEPLESLAQVLDRIANTPISGPYS